ncbi:MAG: PAS domain S-box protein [Oculatellaceae cyanobacterium Prado106]|jgi:hypothetical protein|nr:PAS domain S-box protein [Oculatellaceae cyanobacterium Prado106]
MDHRSRLILIVDDSPEDRERYRRYLLSDRQHAYTIVEAESGQQGLDLCLQHQPDVVVLNYQLPDLNGLEFLAKLKVRTQQPMPVVMVTRQGNEAIAVQTMKAGAQDYLKKEQITSELLQQTVNSIVETILSERKRVEAELQESQALFAAFMRHSPAAAYIKDEQGHYLYVNPPNEQIFNRPLADWLGKTDFELLPLLEAQQWWNNDQTALAANQAMEFIETCQHADGEHTYLSYKFPIQLSLERRLVAGLSLDISDRKHLEKQLSQTEDRFRTIAEAVPNPLFEADAKGFNIWSSERWCQFTGQTSEQAQGHGWTTVIHPDDLLTNQQQWERSLREGVPFEMKQRIRRFDGEYVWVIVRSLPLQDEQGEIYRWLGCVTDVDGLVRAESANRIKDEFLAVLFHELRTPLNPILGWSKLLQKDTPPLTLQRGLETIERNAQLQTHLIEDLLDVSRILQGKLSLNIQPVNLTDSVQAALETIHLAAQAKSIQLETTLADSMGTVAGDASRLQQVVWDLLSNAVKFTPEGGQVRVNLARIDGQAQLQVMDTGKGIDPDFLPYVFERFQQEDSSTTSKRFLTLLSLESLLNNS